jgi:hypothetical protein
VLCQHSIATPSFGRKKSVTYALPLTGKDFRIETDRRGSNFYYPMASAAAKLNQVGTDADNLVLRYHDREMRLVEAYKEFALQLSGALMSNNLVFAKIDAFTFPVA